MCVCCIRVFLAPVVSTAYKIHFRLKLYKPSRVNKKSRRLGSQPYLKLTSNLVNVEKFFSLNSLAGFELLCKWSSLQTLKPIFQENF